MGNRNCESWAAIIAVALLLACSAPAQQPAGPTMVTMASPSPLYEIQLMVQTGSADDPQGKEGTARMTAQMLIEGGFGDPKNPITQEKLAEITRPWGEKALPRVRVDKEATTFSMTVPRDSLPAFVRRVLKPMFTQPLWLPAELERLRREALTEIQSRLRFENQELLGLLALDNYILSDLRPPLAHLSLGTVRGLQAVTISDMQKFYREKYHAGLISVAASITDPRELALLRTAFPAGKPQPASVPPKPRPLQGRHVIIITQPNAIATGIHFGYPIDLTRGHPDYWPLFVGNVALGTHRDEFGRLYQEIRQERGYNYGDYSYIEYFHDGPQFLFPLPTTPRRQQYFSIWVRPVGHQYTHFIMKAATAELDRFIREGLTAAEVADAKVKARTLYLNYAENKARQLGYRLDDLFYGMKKGYLETMLRSIDAVTSEQVNAAIKRHQQSANLKYIIVTNQDGAAKLADDIASGVNVVSKTKDEYHISDPIPPDKQQMLEKDKQWAAYPLHIPRDNIAVVKADQMFETAEIPGAKAAAGAAK